MTSVQTHPVRTRHPHDESGPRVRDDMTVEVALSVMAGAQVDHLILCDGDDQCTGSVTRVQLAALRAGVSYTDRLRLRDVLDTPVRLSSRPCSFSL
ncbi:CBS domain-containing protein [Streptomyces maremycinicus]|uniref:CBS domain-containing protein n=1 Tax=Streptomyces maremycinicus TaxID=1679753 RepID=UPI00078765D3